MLKYVAIEKDRANLISIIFMGWHGKEPSYLLSERERKKQTNKFYENIRNMTPLLFFQKHIYICLCLRRLQKDGFHTVGRGCLWEVRLSFSMFESSAVRVLCVHRRNSRSDLCSPQEACSPGTPKVCSGEPASPRAGRGPTQVRRKWQAIALFHWF